MSMARWQLCRYRKELERIYSMWLFLALRGGATIPWWRRLGCDGFKFFELLASVSTGHAELSEIP